VEKRGPVFSATRKRPSNASTQLPNRLSILFLESREAVENDHLHMNVEGEK
jgi:hypothetical protein